MSGNYIRSAILVGSIPLMAEWSRDAVALAQELGIDPVALRDPDIPVPATPVLAFYERAAEMTGCRSFGLRMAARTGMAVVGPLWILLRQAQTLEQMLEDLVTHFDLYTQAAVTSFRREGSARRLCWATSTGIAEREVQMAEFSVAVLCAEIRRHAPAGWEPASVSFRHAAPPDRAEMRRVLGSNLSFNQADNSILIERALLDRSLRAEGSRTRELLSHVLRQQGEPTDPGLVERADGVVRALLPYASCTLADLGRALGMAPRTLQEHLQAQGHSFQQIRDAARADLAAKYLRHSRMSLTQIAEVLGYSELSAFSRSFRRWHGVPARSLRTPSLPKRTRGVVAESAPSNP
ncbi:MAG: AraC family transcriptional regulator [Panacagrimonas sp.]